MDDMMIRKSDAIIVTASVRESSNLEVYIFEEDKSNLYIHHEIILASFPLCLEWMPFVPGTSEKGNFIAVGTFMPIIEIWNLDEMNTIHPSCALGAPPGDFFDPSLPPEADAHLDAVISLSLNHT